MAHIMLSGAAAFFRFSNYFSSVPGCYLPLLRAHFLADVLVGPNLHFRVRSDCEIPEGTCSQFVMLPLQIISASWSYGGTVSAARFGFE